MTRDREMKLIAYVLGDLDAEASKQLDAELSESTALRKELAQLQKIMADFDSMEAQHPSSRVQHQFYGMLQSAQTAEHSAAPRRNRWYTWSAAAVVVLLVGVAIGVTISGNGPRQATDNVALAEIQTMLEESSSATRIAAVSNTWSMEGAPEVLDVLFDVVRNDESTSVRLAAIDALSVYMGDQYVLVELASSLAYQDKPVVQIALINLLTQYKSAEAIPQLESLIQNEQVPQPVKDQARVGLMRLM